MTEHDIRETDDEQTAPAAATSSTVAPPTGTEPGGESLTSTAIPATSPTTTALGTEDAVGLEVTAELERAAELALAVAVAVEHGTAVELDAAEELGATVGLDAAVELDTAVEPGTSAGPGHEVADTEPVRVWVDVGEVLVRLGVDGWAEYDELDERIRTLHEELGPGHESTQAAMDDLRAMASLSQQDEETYQAALVAAVEQIAVERGISVEVWPVSATQTNAPGTPGADLLATAVRRAVLPQLGRAPHDLAADRVAAEVAAAGRTYRERIATDERPPLAAEHDQLELALRAELQADELLPEGPAIPPDSPATDDVSTETVT